MRYMILIYGKESDWENVSPERAGEIMPTPQSFAILACWCRAMS